MRFMMLVRADKKTEAGVLPDEKLLAAMGKYNEELVKAGVLLAWRGCIPASGRARELHRRQAHGDRRPVRRGQGADRGLLADRGQVARTRPSSGPSACRSATARSRSARSSRSSDFPASPAIDRAVELGKKSCGKA